MKKEKKNSRGKYDRYCDWCGSYFETYYPQQRFCKHPECRNWAEKLRQMKRKPRPVFESEIERVVEEKGLIQEVIL